MRENESCSSSVDFCFAFVCVAEVCDCGFFFIAQTGLVSEYAQRAVMNDNLKIDAAYERRKYLNKRLKTP